MTWGEIVQEAWDVVKAWGDRQRRRVAQIPLIWRVALGYLAAIALAEALTTLIDPLVGLGLHGLLLLALLLQAAVSDRLDTRRFLLALSLAPLTRLLSLVLPLQHFLLVYWYLLVGAPLFLAAYFAAHAGELRAAEIGLTPGRLPVQLLIGLSGIGLGYLENRILHPAPLIAGLRLDLLWLPALILLVFTGLLEEFIFRGLMQRTATNRLGRAGGLVYVAVIFATLHLGYHSWVDLAFVFAVALAFGWLVLRSGSILGVTLAHGLTNIGLFLVFPFLLGGSPQPATAVPAAPAALRQQSAGTILLPGPALAFTQGWTGGAPWHPQGQAAPGQTRLEEPATPENLQPLVRLPETGVVGGIGWIPSPGTTTNPFLTPALTAPARQNEPLILKIGQRIVTLFSPFFV